jgi:hypothetical protein
MMAVEGKEEKGQGLWRRGWVMLRGRSEWVLGGGGDDIGCIFVGIVFVSYSFFYY